MRLFGALLLALGGLAWGQDRYLLGTDESRVVVFERPVDRVLVTHPEVATVRVLNSRELLLTGKRQGQTEVVVWGGEGGERRVIVDVQADAARQAQLRDRIGRLLAELDPERRVQVEVQDERVVLTGSVPNTARGQRIEALVAALGHKPVNLLSVTGSQQVQLFVRVAEVVKGNPLRSGAAFLDKRDRFGVLSPGSASQVGFLLELEQAMSSATLAVPHSDAFQLIVNPAKGSLFGLLSLLEGHNLARVLAQPTLVVESGKTAKFLAGGEVPIPIAQDNNTISIDYKQFGVMVEFTPVILDDDVIALHVAPEVSNIDENAGIALGGITIPGFRTRRTETSVQVKDGESFVVGGLLQDEIRSAVQKVPLLGDIPVLGALFRSSAYEKNESELAIVVSPRIVRPIPAGQRVALPGENLERPSTAEAILLGKVVSESGTPARYPIDEVGLEMPR